MRDIFNKDKLDDKYLKQLLEEFWFAPCDAYLRAPEVAIWKSIKPKRPVLSIGCADGKMDAFLYNHIVTDVAIDNNKDVISEAKKSGLYKKVILASADKLPFKKNSFSSVISNSTFEHIKNDKKAVKEASRVLKTNGDLILTVPTNRFVKFMKSNGVVGEKFKKYNKRVSHLHYRSLEEWKEMFDESGLDLKYYRYYFPPIMMKIRWILFRVTTIKLYKRELWSYLKDSPYGKLFPANLINRVEMGLLRNSYKKAFDVNGCWIFLWASKK